MVGVERFIWFTWINGLYGLHGPSWRAHPNLNVGIRTNDPNPKAGIWTSDLDSNDIIWATVGRFPTFLYPHLNEATRVIYERQFIYMGLTYSLYTSWVVSAGRYCACQTCASLEVKSLLLYLLLHKPTLLDRQSAFPVESPTDLGTNDVVPCAGQVRSQRRAWAN